MKKLVLLFVAVVVTAASTNVFAQTSTGTVPFAGATHSYWVNSDDNGATQSSGVGNTYSWEVLRTGGEAAATADYDFLGTNSGEDIFNIQIKWLAPAIADGNPYFLVVTESDGTCANKKAIQIDPTNGFIIKIQNVDDNLVDQGAGKEWCAPDVTLNLADANIAYNYGTTILYYRVDAQGLSSDWSFNYAFTEEGKDTDSNVEAFYGADVASATTALDFANGGSINVLGGAQDVIVKVLITNGTDAEGEENDHEITLTLSQFSDGSNAPVSINGAAIPPNTNSAGMLQTVKARPVTTGIGTN